MRSGNSQQRRRSKRMSKVNSQTEKNHPLRSNSAPEISKDTKQPKPTQIGTPVPKRRRIQNFLLFLVRVGTFLSIVVTVYSFYPHLTVSEPSALSNSAFFSYKVDITNNGILPVFAIRCGVGFGLIEPEQGTTFHGRDDFAVQFISTASTWKQLDPGDAFTYSPEAIFGSYHNYDKVKDADFAIVISYVPIFPPIRMNTCAHFVSYTDSGGKQQWFRKPAACPRFTWGEYPANPFAK
jgi:hypothetical protein